MDRLFTCSRHEANLTELERMAAKADTNVHLETVEEAEDEGALQPATTASCFARPPARFLLLSGHAGGSDRLTLFSGSILLRTLDASV